MKKYIEGVVISTAMQNTAVVEVVHRVAHPVYKKTVKRNKKYKVDTSQMQVEKGDIIRIQSTRPISKDKYFTVMKIITQKEKKV